jgi:hypothetical protein
MQIRKLSIGLFILTAALSAQTAPGGSPPGGRGRFGPNGGAGARFLGGEPGMPGRIVKNASFAGDLVTETSQTLSDGNHIKQSTTAHLVRDSEGRTRREQSLNGLGALGAPTADTQAVFISDPVAGVSYALNPSNRTVSRLAEPGRGRGGRNGKQPPPPDGPRWGRGADGANIKTESLGKQTIEGVPAEGSRVTQTIAAGAMGNELPIQVVIERWYSPDLHMDVLTRRNDPRYGETVTKLTNISRAEPSHSFFEPPADYKTVDDRRRAQQ